MKYPYMEEAASAEGEGGGLAAVEVAVEGGNWYDSLPQDMREDQNITKFESMETMAKSWQNAQRMIGQDKIPMPQTDEDWGNVYDRLGRPEDVTGYTVTAPEGAQVNEERQVAFLQKAHELGLNQAQVEGIANWDFESTAGTNEAQQSAMESATNEAMTALKAEWGQAFDQNVNVANRAISEFMSDSDKDFLQTATIDGLQVGNHPVFAKIFNNIGKAMMESGKLEGVGGEQAMTPQDMEDKRNTLMNNPAYTDNRHPEHKQITRQVQQLFEQQFS